MATLNGDTALSQQTFTLDSMIVETNPTPAPVAHSAMPKSTNKKTRPEGRAILFSRRWRYPRAFTRALRRDIFRDAVFL
jgi:hypothetical protein